MRRWIFSAVLVVLSSSSAYAGVFEIGLSSNYRESIVDDDNFEKTLSVTGSISYFFGELSALELSYTKGREKDSFRPPEDVKTTIRTDFELVGLDFVFSFADRESAFQPFIKMGGVYVSKESFLKVEGFSEKEIDTPDAGVAPSAGLGFKIRLSERFRIKLGIDAWTTPLGAENIKIDKAARAGISWFF